MEMSDIHGGLVFYPLIKTFIGIFLWLLKENNNYEGGMFFRRAHFQPVVVIIIGNQCR